MGGSRLRSRWLRIALITSAVLMVVALPATANDHLVEGDDAVVSGTNGFGLNVRAEPSTSSNVHFIADEGTQMTITSGLHEAGGFSWYGVHIEGYDAWVMADYVSGYAASQAEQQVDATGEQVEVVDTNGFGLRLRAEASSQSDTLTVLTEGSVLDVAGDSVTDEAGTTWINLRFNGSTGFAHSNYLAFVSSSSNSIGNDEDQGAENEPEHTDEGQAGQDGDGATNEPEPEPDPEPEPEPEPSSPNSVAVGGNAEIVDTNGYGLNVRAGAGFSNSVVTVAAEGDVVHVLGGPEIDGDGANWWNVDYRGHSGWVHGGYLRATDQEPTGIGSGSGQSSNGGDSSDNGSAEPPPASGTGQQIANQAMQFLGYPYIWGGTTPAGFDCSGFLYYVVNQVTGNGFPRMLESQVNRGTYVPSDQLQPGDLVFQQNTYQWGLSHAGIYIGNGQFIHASTPGTGVTISNLWDSYWGQRYYTARRIS